jgi:hypothetical protein
VQHFRDFGRFQINKRDLGRQREDRISIEEEILHEIGSQPSTRSKCRCFDLSLYAFTHNYSLFTLLFKLLLYSE